MKVRDKCTGRLINVTAVFNSVGDFLYFQDLEGTGDDDTKVHYTTEMVEPIEPNWTLLFTDLSAKLLCEIVRYDQGANSPEDSADLAMNYAKVLIDKLAEAIKEEDDS
jgi:hypothetical protein